MRDAFPILWWLAAAVVIALLLISMGYAASQAILLAVFFLPGMLCARYFYPQLSFEERRKGVLDTLYLTLAILCIEYLALILGHRTALPDDEIPDLLFNPLFILLVLSACILPEILIERRLEARRPYDRMLRFVSDRRPVTLDPAELLYVESNDSEVWLHTRSGEAYRTKTRISQWEALLDRIPIVHPIYSGIKKIASTFLSQQSQSFQKVVMVEYPRKGAWTLAFVVNKAPDTIRSAAKTEENLLTVFVPTAPNPTSGYVIFVPESETRETSFGIEEAFTFHVSMGVVVPGSEKHESDDAVKA